MEEISSTTRGNARSAVKIAESINLYVKRTGQTTFGDSDWRNLCHTLNIKPEGLTNAELLVLKTLNERGACSLNAIASITGLSRPCIQQDIENFLVKKALMKIDGQRKITIKGQELLTRIGV